MASSKDEFGELMALQREAVMPRRRKKTDDGNVSETDEPDGGAEALDGTSESGAILAAIGGLAYVVVVVASILFGAKKGETAPAPAAQRCLS